jgi:nicotinamidase-related amidase
MGTNVYIDNYSVFSSKGHILEDNNLFYIINRDRINTFLITGILKEDEGSCVENSVNDILFMGHKAIIITDCICGPDENGTEKAFQRMKEKGAIITNIKNIELMWRTKDV